MQKTFKAAALFCLAVLLSGCAYFSGGADYTYEYQDGTGRLTKLTVHSTRKIQKGISLKLDPETGAVQLKAGGVGPGENSNRYLFQFLEKIIKIPPVEVK